MVGIEVWLADHPFFPDFLAPLRRRAAEFTAAHPGYEIRVTGHDFRTLPAAVAQAAAAGRAPAVAEYYATASQLARDTRTGTGAPLFTPVERAIGGRTEILGEPVAVGDVVAAAGDYYRYGGELVSVPVTATTPLLYANTTLLARAGVTELPQTWVEVDAAAKAVAALTDGPQAAITWPNHGWLFQQAVAGQGALLADRDNGRSGRATEVYLDSPAVLAYAEWWQRLHRDGHYLYTGAPADWGGAFEAFVQQRVALTVGSSVQTGAIVGAGRAAGFEVAAGRLPYSGEAPFAGNPVSGQSLWLAAGLDESTADGALAFIQYLLAPASAADWHRSTGFLPITHGTAALLDAEGWFDQHPQQRAAAEQLAAGDGSPAALGAVLGDLAGIQDLLTDAMADVLTGGADPAARFARADADAQRLLADYDAPCLAAVPRSPEQLRVG